MKECDLISFFWCLDVPQTASADVNVLTCLIFACIRTESLDPGTLKVFTKEDIYWFIFSKPVCRSNPLFVVVSLLHISILHLQSSAGWRIFSPLWGDVDTGLCCNISSSNTHRNTHTETLTHKKPYWFNTALPFCLGDFHSLHPPLTGDEAQTVLLLLYILCSARAQLI